MTLKDRLKSLFGVKPEPPAMEYLGGATLPMDHPIAKMLMKNGSLSGVSVRKDSPEGRQIMEWLTHAGADVAAQPQSSQQAEALANLGSDYAGNSLVWSVWDTERKTLVADLPGWSPCRFYHRVGLDEARGVFGAVKGEFGIWRMPFDVCDQDDDESPASKVLPSLTHLPTGLDFGLFADVATARDACDAALALDWSQMPPADAEESCRRVWRERLMQLRQTWGFNGIAMSERCHAHNPGGDREVIPIFAKADPAEGKPEKVS